MAKQLLARQARLIDYLTSGAAIFGDCGGTPIDRSLRGIDRRLLRLEARFSHEKRMEKIAMVFARTFALMGEEKAAILRQFVETCPPTSIGRLENASQFHDFLVARRQRDATDPPYLLDVAACELACAKVRTASGDRATTSGSRKRARQVRIRRQPGIVLLRCTYDIQPIFEAGPAEFPPLERDTMLVIAIPPDATHPQVFEVIPAVFDLLGTLDGWTDGAPFGRKTEIRQLIRDLTRYGFIEVTG